MKKHLSIPPAFIYLIIVFFIASCASFDNGWNYFVQKESLEDPELLLQKAHEIETKAATAEQVIQLIAAFKEVEKADPDNYYALWKIGNYHILMGAAYAEKKKDKKYHYKEAIKYCEKAMCTNEMFKLEVQSGSKICESCDKLTIDQIDAMGYWYTARFYYFKECLAPLGRVFNTRIVIDNNTMIERIDNLDSTWAGGGNYFSRGLYYIAVPEKFGGSKERAKQEFAMAIEIGPDYLVNRWGRAKYLYSLTGDDEGYKSDLEWVVSRDPHNSGNPYPWNVYFHEDAKELLTQIE